MCIERIVIRRFHSKDQISLFVSRRLLYTLPKKTDGETWKRWLSRAMWLRFNRRLPERTSDTVLSLPSSAAMSRCESPRQERPDIDVPLKRTVALQKYFAK
jgi:hypothetical protein